MQHLHKTPKEIVNFRIHFAAVVACFAAVIIGYDAGFVGGSVVLPEFEKEFSFDTLPESKVKLDKANIISLFHAGAFFGSYLIYPIGVFWGRLWGFKIAAFFLIVGSAIQLASNKEIGLGPLLAGRFVSGIGIGAVSNLAPMYVSEVAPANIRGRLIGMYEIAWQIGGMVGYFINYGVEQHLTGARQWLVPFAIQLVPAGIFSVGVFFIPESPRWFFTRDNKEKALESLCYLRQLDAGHPYIGYEINSMENESQERKKIITSEFFSPFKLLFGDSGLRLRLLKTALLFAFQNATGINAINYYSVAIFKTIGINSKSAGLLSTGVFGIIKGISCFIWAFYVVDRFGRKLPTFIFGSLCGFSLWYLGAYIKVANPEETLNGQANAGSRSALAFFYIWTVSYAFSWSGVPWVYVSEVFDGKVRNLAQCFNASANWFWAFILSRFTQQMIDSMKFGIFFFFAAFLFVFQILFMLFYPETRGVPITHVDMLFEKGVPAYRAHSRVMKLLHADYTGEVVSKDNDKSSDIMVDMGSSGSKSVSVEK